MTTTTSRALLAVLIPLAVAGCGADAPTSTPAAAPTTTPSLAAPAPSLIRAPPTSGTASSSAPRPTSKRTTTGKRTSRRLPCASTGSQVETGVGRDCSDDDDGPVIFGQTNAQAYRQCVNSPDSPGPAQCKAITDAGGRGE